MLTNTSFENLSQPLIDEAEQLQLTLLERLSYYAGILVTDPTRIIRPRRFQTRVANEIDKFMRGAQSWTDDELARAYQRGISEINGRVRELGVDTGDGSIGRQLFTRGFDPIDIDEEILENWPRHRDPFSMIKNATIQELENARLPILRDTDDKLRRIIIVASRNEYRNADRITRRSIQQRLMNEFSDRGITGIVYSDGRRMNIASYAELVARNQSGNAARQAALNRQTQLGEDLMRMSTHYPCSDLCIDWQGGVYSISGNSDQYPALDTAISGGAFHSNCKHSLSPYYPGISPAQETRDISKAENKKMYEAQQRQREIERKIRKYKARQASAISEQAEERAQQYISKWQAQQRSLIEDNSFLRRNYSRESI